MTEKRVLGGRTFVAVGSSTAEHDEWMTGSLARAGLIPLPPLQAGETHGEYGLRLYAGVCAHRETFNLLGGLIMPEGQLAADWTPETAAETIAYLKRLVGPEDRRTITDSIITLLIPFFSSGIASFMSSGTFSGPNPGDPVNAPKNPSEPGPSSSGQSPEEPSTAGASSIAGR